MPHILLNWNYVPIFQILLNIKHCMVCSTFHFLTLWVQSNNLYCINKASAMLFPFALHVHRNYYQEVLIRYFSLWKSLWVMYSSFNSWPHKSNRCFQFPLFIARFWEDNFLTELSGDTHSFAVRVFNMYHCTNILLLQYSQLFHGLIFFWMSVSLFSTVLK